MRLPTELKSLLQGKPPLNWLTNHMEGKIQRELKLDSPTTSWRMFFWKCKKTKQMLRLSSMTLLKRKLWHRNSFHSYTQQQAKLRPLRNRKLKGFLFFLVLVLLTPATHAQITTCHSLFTQENKDAIASVLKKNVPIDLHHFRKLLELGVALKEKQEKIGNPLKDRCYPRYLAKQIVRGYLAPDKVLIQALTSESEAEKTLALEIIIWNPDEAFIKRWMAYCLDSQFSEDIRRRIFDAVTRYNYPSTEERISWLREIAEGDHPPNLRDDATLKLWFFDDFDLIPCRQLLKLTNPFYRVYALDECLFNADLQDYFKDIEPVLNDLLFNSEVPELVRLNTLSFLSQTTDPRYAGILRRLLKENELIPTPLNTSLESIFKYFGKVLSQSERCDLLAETLKGLSQLQRKALEENATPFWRTLPCAPEE